MIRLLLLGAVMLGLNGCGASEETSVPEMASPSQLEPSDIRSGYTFLTADTQALQNDDFANPGFLWVEQGREIFASSDGDEPSCASCHGRPETALDGVAARYPAMDQETATMVNIEGRINLCRTRHQDLAPLAYESDDLLALTAYVGFLSRGVSQSVPRSAATEPYYERGERYFYTRRGQLNLACSQCHNENWGKKLRGDTISQGHGNGFPAYRFEWQALGSLHRRLHDCDTGVRAEPRPLGSEDYVAVEYYLARRSEGLAVETPAVRR